MRRIFLNFRLAIWLSFGVLVFLLVQAHLAVQAASAPSLAVFPDKFEWSLSRGQTRDGEIRVVNTSDFALPIRFNMVRWDAEDEIGGMNFIETGEDPSFDITRWVDIKESNIILESGEARDIAFTISVPANAEPGGKYGAVFVEPVVPEIYFEGGETRILPRIAILFLLDIPVANLEEQTSQPLTVAEFSVEGRSSLLSEIASRFASLFYAPGTVFAATPAVSVDMLSAAPSGFILRVRNDGITHIRPSGTVSVFNAFDVKIAAASLAPTTILPHKVRQFPVEFIGDNVPLVPSAVERQFALGEYKATVVLEGVGNQPFVTSFSYWVFPWQVFIAAGIMIFALWLVRKRLIAALRVLFNIHSADSNV